MEPEAYVNGSDQLSDTVKGHGMNLDSSDLDVTLTVAKIGNGAVNPPEGTKTYIRDENATVSATPGAAFDHWEGDLADATIDGASITIPMTADKSVTAVFKPEYILTMATEGGGTVSPEESPPTPHVYREGDIVHLSATGNNEWIFDHWTGDVSDPQSATPTITMTEDKTATAHFIEGVLITVNKEGQGTVSPGTGVYPKGGTKTFTASPSESWRWDRWEGDINGEDPNDASLELPMDQPRTITAYFIQLVTLTMEKNLIGNLPANGGTLSPAVGEEHSYDINTEVTLTAAADSGWRFKEWTGGASGTVAPLLLEMDGDKQVTGHFIQQHLVTTEVVVNGTIVLSPTGSVFDHGAQVTFEFEEEHYKQPFHHWAGLPDSFSTPEWGEGTSTANPVNVAITESLHVIGYEEDEIVTLTTHVDAEGCEGCAVDPVTAEYVVGSYATVEATAPDGWTFDHWEGQVPSADVESNPLSLLMNDDKDITAVFQAWHTLTLSKEGQGVVDPEVGVSHVIAHGETASLAATPAQGWNFDHWSGLSETSYTNGPAGPGTSAANPLSLVMERDESVTGVFVAECLLDLEETGIVFELPNFVQTGAETIEELGSTVFGDFKFKVGGTFEESPGTCQNLDGTRSAAIEKTGTAKFEFEKTDIPLIWGITTKATAFIMGKSYTIKFTGGLRGDIGAFIEGDYSVLEYGCPCLDEEYCASGTGIYSLTGGISGAVDIGTRLVVAWDSFPFGNAVEVELCNISLANIAMSGRFGVEQKREGGCNPEDCIVAYVDPIRFTISVAIAGFNCTAIEMQYPEKEGQKLWEIYEGCENP